MQSVKVPMCANNFTATRSPSVHRQAIKRPLKKAKDLFNQARHLRKTGDADDFSAARPLLERAVAISEKALGPEHPVVAEGLNTLAIYLEDAGYLGAARPLFERAMAIYEKALGPEHPVVADCLSNLALYLHSAGDAEDFTIAQSLYERALAINEKALGLEHPDVAHSLTDLALYLCWNDDSEDCAVARPLYERALAIIEDCYGPTSAEAGVVLYQLGPLLVLLNEFDLAETLLRRELDITIEQSGRNSPDTLESIDRLADLLKAKDNLSAIVILRKEQLAHLEKSANTEPEELLLAKQSFAVSLRNAGQLDEAEPLMQESLEFSMQTFGKHSLEAARACSAMGMLQKEKRDLTKAKWFLKRALQIRTDDLGPDHEATKFVMSRLENLTKSQDCNLEQFLSRTQHQQQAEDINV